MRTLRLTVRQIELLSEALDLDHATTTELATDPSNLPGDTEGFRDQLAEIEELQELLAGDDKTSAAIGGVS